MPACTKEKQLSQQEVDTGRQLARVRIHVERVIGAIDRNTVETGL